MSLPSAIEPRTTRVGQAFLLFDAALMPTVEPGLLDPGSRVGGAVREARGRGSVSFLNDGARQYVLRHYRRGGLFAPLLGDVYLWTGLAATRAWREWHLLAALHAQGLPVPRPVAARVVRYGLYYRADLLTERVQGARPLAELWQAGAVSEIQWRRIGACIARFHAVGVCHADLNAHNLLMTDDDRVYLLDFDRGRRRRPGRWRERNLQRLARSLRKFAPHADGGGFSDAWTALLAGYQGSSAR